MVAILAAVTVFLVITISPSFAYGLITARGRASSIGSIPVLGTQRHPYTNVALLCGSAGMLEAD